MTDREDSKLKGGNVPRKSQIVCKFWMIGNCTRKDKCEYLHQQNKNNFVSYLPFNNSQEEEKILKSECQLYNLGFCKNGPLCNKEHKQLDNSLLTEEMPIWYLEYLFEKPIRMIFREFELNNSDKAFEVKQNIMKQQLLNMPTEFNNFQKQNITEIYNKNYNHRNQQQNLYNYSNNNFDIYTYKKNQILENLSLRVRYFFIRCKNSDFVSFSMENNLLILNSQILLKLTEARKSCDDVICIVYDDSTNNFCGYCKYKFEILEINDYDMSSFIDKMDFNFSLLKIEYLWKTKLSGTKVELLKNPLQDDALVLNSRDGQEIAIDTGFYMCRLMIKRLSKEEVQNYLSLKNEHAKNKPNNYYDELTNIKINNEDRKVINISDFKLKPKSFEDNLNLIINGEINKSNSKNNNNNIIVTNISNLQVNISQNSYREGQNRNKVSKSPVSKTKRKNKRRRSKSYSSSDSESTVKLNEKTEILKHKRKRSRSKSIGQKETIKTKVDKKEPRTNFNNNSSTSVSTAFETCSFFNNNNTPKSEKEISKTTEIFQEKKFKSKLFSNAMQKIHTNLKK